uniref:Putative head-tail joining protein n=1 Tax=viral metagenome TaxID=1070528 RepID=A0A6M3JWS9_9ZZZZ
MRAGQLRNRITLRKPVYSVSSFNETVVSYTDVATVWAYIEWGSGRRYMEASQLNSEVQGVISIRYRTDVKPEWRIEYGTRTILILSIANVVERDRQLQLNCKEFQD